MACFNYDINVQSTDLANATGNSNPALNGVLFVGYTDCSGNPGTEQYNTAGVFLLFACIDNSFPISESNKFVALKLQPIVGYSLPFR